MQTELGGILFTLACLLLCISIAQPIAKKIQLPETVLIGAIGIGLGVLSSIVINSMGLDIFEGAAESIMNFPINSEGFLLVFLPLLVFQGATEIDVRSLAHETGTVLLLAIVAVLVSTGLIGFAVYPFTTQALPVCLLLGCIVATTDPSAVSGIFRDVGAAPRLGRLVEGEALLNDAAAIAIFAILISAILNPEAVNPVMAVVGFLKSFVGAIIVGVIAARLILVLVNWISGYQAAEVSLTLVLPYLVYILCDDIFGFSGVVAVAAAGLTMSAYGTSSFRPQTWEFIKEIWEQLAFWAGTMVFLLASLFIPRLLFGMTMWDLMVIAIAWGAGLVARGVVCFGLLPLLSMAKLSPVVPAPFRITMVWGGIRGAITLALALAVTENQELPPEVTHFVGLVATGFVLGTLLINGTTLRMVVIALKLDQLSPVDTALRGQVINLGLGNVRNRLEEVAKDLGFSLKTTQGVVNLLSARQERVQDAGQSAGILTDSTKINIALLTLANQERSLLLDLFRINNLASRQTMEQLLRSAEAMVDGARADGLRGYKEARSNHIKPSVGFRFAGFLHSYFGFDAPLMKALTERFEQLLILHLVVTSLMRFVRDRLRLTMGTHVASVITELLINERLNIDDALNSLRLHYPGYAESLESRLLRQIALRIEEEEYDALGRDNLISDELARELTANIEQRRAHYEAPALLNLRAGIIERLRGFMVFNGISDEIMAKLAKSVSMRFVAPGEEVFKEGETFQGVYAQLSGMCEAIVDGKDFKTQNGSLLGAVCYFKHKGKAVYTLTAVSHTHLLVIPRKVFAKFVKEYPVVRYQVLNPDLFITEKHYPVKVKKEEDKLTEVESGMSLIDYKL